MKWYLSFVATLLFTIGLASLAFAQDRAAFECDNQFGMCGTPNESGGGCGCGCGSILINRTDLGDTYQFADDYDNDGVEDSFDNCPFVANEDQLDSDGDEVGNNCDNCPSAANRDQANRDGDIFGDNCDDDIDGDEIVNSEDNCELVPNGIDQLDLDKDGLGDACDLDIDGDGMDNLADPCPMNATLTAPTDEQLASCFPDLDGDGIFDMDDVCPAVWDLDQLDMDNDGEGDACDPDIDEDGILNLLDNCPYDINPADDTGLQLDSDRDGLGDKCDDRFCLVVYGDEKRCLDPASAELKVYSPDLIIETGEESRLRLFANRENQAMRFTWTVASQPEGSNATVHNPTGTVTVSVLNQYAYLKDSIPVFEPDLPGEYELKLSVTTIWEDRVSLTKEATSEHIIKVTATGEPVSDGGACQAVVSSDTTAGGTAALLVLFGALGVVVWRRRRR